MELSVAPDSLPLYWVERDRPRRFGKVFDGAPDHLQRRTRNGLSTGRRALPTDIRGGACSHGAWRLLRAGEITACRHIAQTRGIMLDPIYTLAAWETAQALLSGRTLSCARDAGAAPPPLDSIAADSGGGTPMQPGSAETAEVAGSRRQPRLLRRCTLSAAGARGEALSQVVVARGPPRVLMLHTGGTLGLFGLAQSSKKHAAEILTGRPHSSSGGRAG